MSLTLGLDLPPLLADTINIRLRTKPARWKLTGRAFGVATVILLNGLLLFAILDGKYHRIFPSPIGPTPFGLGNEERFMALRRLQEKGLPGLVFSDYNLGSLVEYNLYPEPAYVDNRPEAFPASFWQNEYLPALALSDRWEQMVQERNICTVIVSLTGVGEAFVNALTYHPDWQLIHLDFLCAIWMRRDTENQILLNELAYTEGRLENYRTSIAEKIQHLDEYPFWKKQIVADQIVYELYSLICIGRNETVWPLLWQMYLRYPDYQIVHELLRVCAPPDALTDVSTLLEKQARWPLSAKQVIAWGRLLESQNKTEQAEQVYRRGRIFFPLNKTL